MSTKERYGTIVWDALALIFNSSVTPDDGWVSVGEVARVAKVSKPTAKKYLDMLVEMDTAKRATITLSNSTVSGYRPQWGQS